MKFDTKIHIVNKNGDSIHPSYRACFPSGTKVENLNAYMLKKGFEPSISWKFLDEYGEYVTFDTNDPEDHNPFDAEIMPSATVRPNNRPGPIIHLQFTPNSMTGHNVHLISSRQPGPIIRETRRTDIQHPVQMQGVDSAVSIRLPSDPQMGFINGHNVKYKQRDQYISDEICVSKIKKNGKITMIRGQKNETNKYRSILPHFGIWHHGIKDRIHHVWTLCFYLVLDVYKSGKRSLYHHPNRTFVKNDNVGQPLDRWETPITNNDWMNEKGVKLKFKVVTIKETKTHPNMQLNLLCNLEKSNENKLLNTSQNYSKSRLAGFLCLDGNIQWDTLVLSKKMIFLPGTTKKTKSTSSVTSSSDLPTSAGSISSASNGSKKRQTKSNQQSKRQKTSIKQCHSTVINSSAYNNDSSIYSNQNHPITHDNIQIEVNAPQTTFAILDVTETKNLLDALSEHGYLYDHSNKLQISHENTMNASNDLDWDDLLETRDNNALIGSDISLNDAGFLDDDLLNL